MKQHFLNLKLNQKLLVSRRLSVALLVVLSVIACLSHVVTLNTTKAYSEQLVPQLSHLAQVSDLLQLQQRKVQQLLQSPTGLEQLETTKELGSVHHKMVQSLHKVHPKLAGVRGKETFQALESNMVREWAGVERVISLTQSGQVEEAKQWYNQQGVALQDTFLQQLGVYRAILTQDVMTKQAQTLQVNQILVMAFVGCVLITILLQVLLSSWFAQSLMLPLQLIQKVTQEIANGNLYQDIPEITSQDELGDICRTLKTMLNNLRQLIRSIQSSTTSMDVAVESMLGTTASIKNICNATEEVETNARNVYKAVDKMAENMQNTSHVTESMTTSVHTIVQSLEEISASLTQMSQSSTQASQISQQAEKDVIHSKVTIDELSLASHEIEHVVALIQNVASQTNLLALNATIEAASAGESGKGFAVVANEVKELAKQTNQATTTIAKQIENMRLASEKTIEAIGRISTMISSMNDINVMIAGVVEKQFVTIKDASQNANSLVNAASTVSGNVQHSANIAHQVSEEAKMTQNSISLITRNIEETTTNLTTAGQTSSKVLEMQHCASKLSHLSTRMGGLLTRFTLYRPSVPWSDEYSVQHEKIDSQHKRLFALVNELNEGIKGSMRREQIASVLDELIEYTKAHFGAEERMMLETQYPQYEQHKAAHDHFATQVLNFQQQFNSGKADLGKDIIDMLYQWLVNHICVVDQQYSNHFARHNAT